MYDLHTSSGKQRLVINSGKDASIIFFTSFQSPEYCPKVGSGGYAILIALYKNNATSEKSKMWRQELIDAAEEYSNESMNRRPPGAQQYYTPWSTSTTLVKKQLIIR